MIRKVRPQIFLAILVLGVLAIIGVREGMPEIATGTIGGIIALGMNAYPRLNGESRIGNVRGR